MVAGRRGDLQPFFGITEDFPGGKDGAAISLKVIVIDRIEQQVDGVDVESSATERQRDDRGVVTWKGILAVGVALRSGDLGMYGFDVSGGSNNKDSAGVKDGGAALESETLATYGHGERSFPEAFFIDVLDGDEGFRVEFGTVETSKGDLAIIEAVGNSGNLVRRDSLADQPLLRESFDR